MSSSKIQENMPKLSFKTELFTINSWTLIRLPKNISTQLPSKGMVMVEGTINGFPIRAALEPDGKKSHWFKVDNTMLKTSHLVSGDIVLLEITPVKEWPEPELPEDLQTALSITPKVNKLWKDITPMARWDWIRWIRSTKNVETRKKRIHVAFSKLNSGERRPCCFNRTLCTEPYVSHNGVLLEPTQVM